MQISKNTWGYMFSGTKYTFWTCVLYTPMSSEAVIWLCTLKMFDLVSVLKENIQHRLSCHFNSRQNRFPQSLDLVTKRITTIPTLKKLARQLPGKLVDDRRLGLGNCKGKKKKKAAFKFRRCPYSYNHFFIRHEVREKWALYTKCFCWCHENCENYTSVDCYLSALVL